MTCLSIWSAHRIARSVRGTFAQHARTFPRAVLIVIGLSLIIGWSNLAATSAHAQSYSPRQQATQAPPAAFTPRTGASSRRAIKVATIVRPPFMFQTDDGPAGFSIELWQLITERIGRPTEFVV
ncbi:MAG: hypothetical protein AAGG99_08790, partial [Pseudomonadota bacterium]